MNLLDPNFCIFYILFYFVFMLVSTFSSEDATIVATREGTKTKTE